MFVRGNRKITEKNVVSGEEFKTRLVKMGIVGNKSCQRKIAGNKGCKGENS